MKNEKLRSYVIVSLPFLVLVLIHVILGIRMQQPFIFADELGYLGHARYLANAAHMPNLQGKTFYHFGYSIFLLPAFWFFSDPYSIYRAVIITNSILISLLYFPLYYILHTLFKNSTKVALTTSFVTSLYPAFVLQSNLAWAENAFIPLYAFLIASFGAFLDRKSYWTAVIFGLAAGFLFVVHPRGIPIIPLAIVYLVILACFRILPKTATLVSIGVIIAIYIIATLVNSHLKAIGWNSGGEMPAAGLIYRAATHTTHLFSYADLKNFLLSMSGQILYLAQATYGLFLLGIIYTIMNLLYAFRHTRCIKDVHDNKVTVLIFFLLTSLGILFASSVIMINITRADHIIYGRYNEGFLALYISLAIIGLYSKESNILYKRQVQYLIIILIVCLTILVLKGHSYEIFSSRFNTVNIWGVYPVIKRLGRFDIGIISFVAILLFIFLMLFFRRSFFAGNLLLILLFSIVIKEDYKILLRDHNWAKNKTTLVSNIRKLRNIERLSYDISLVDHQALFAYQYLLPDIVFERFSSDKDEKPPSPVVISEKNWRYAETLDARFVAGERWIDNALWVLPGEVQLQLPSASSYIDVTLGAEKVQGIWESGFHWQGWLDKKPVRWTNGSAKLVVPLDEKHLPTALQIDIVKTAPWGTRLRVLVNGVEIFNEKIPSEGLSRSFNLSDLHLKKRIAIELLSGIFVPKDVLKGSKDYRSLGVMVSSIRLIKDER